MANTSEGLLRISKVVRWSGIALTILTLIIVVISIFEGSGSDLDVLLMFGGGVASFFYFSSLALAWIIEGFAKPK